jgi:hypothetical protein
MTISENLDTFLADFGVSVQWGAVSGSGVLDMPDQLLAGGVAISTEYSLLVKASLFAEVQWDDALTVDGVAYKARETRKIDDGTFCRILLQRSA